MRVRAGYPCLGFFRHKYEMRDGRRICLRCEKPNWLDRTIQETFWSHVRKGDGCWEWTGAIFTATGHAQFNWKGKSKHASRYAWELIYGEITKDSSYHGGLVVCHHCDNGICVRPDHLFLGTQGDNLRDMISKGRGRFGPNAPGNLTNLF